MKVDIVLFWLNSYDKEWQKDYLYYKNQELTNGMQSISNQQAFGDERFRDWDTLKYWFRAIEQNCEWFNKIFLILYSPNQIPDWLDTTNPKLRIVYHSDYIPKQYLPTFNALEIEHFIYKIEDLSEDFILFNDDVFVINKIPKDFYWKGEKLLLDPGPQYFRTPYSIWEKIVYNGMKLIQRDYPISLHYFSRHLANAHKKSAWTALANKYGDWAKIWY